jgi:two-component system, cell cycle sensor histidine kinase and response regulator CckA
VSSAYLYSLHSSLAISLDQPPVILIIDDALDGREALRTLLSGQGYTLAFATNGADGLAKAAELVPDLLLLDVMMPGMDGFEVCRQIRANTLLAEIPILLITALDDRQSRLKGIEAGADDFISKYFDATELRARVRTIIRLNRHRRLLLERMKFERVIEFSPNGVLLVTGDGLIALLNPAIEHMLGVTKRDEILGQSVMRFISEESTNSFIGFLQEAVAAPTYARRFEIDMVRLDGTVFPAEIDIGHLAWDDGALAQIAVRDITESKQLQARLFQAQKMESIGRLAGGVAHDFNNLLTAIIGHTGLALESLPATAPERDDLLAIERASQSAANLTHQLLAFARKQLIAPRILDLNELILTMDHLLRRLIGENIQLITRPGANLGLVQADPGQIEQVIINLAINARDAMPEGGQLIIATENSTIDPSEYRQYPEIRTGDYVVFSITDTGSGMDESTRAHIFEPFFTTKEAGRGTGLGLATCYGVISQHGGNIIVTSAIGKGTSFRIYLPLVAGSAEALPERAINEPLPRGSETVLLVEDEEMVRQLTARLLQGLGYDVLVTSDGEEALALVQQTAAIIDLVLTDIVMPKMGGLALARHLKAHDPTITVLFMSGYIEHSMTDTQPEADLLQKPFSTSDLARSIRRALDTRSSPE